MTSERRYRGLFENSPISLWEEDFSQVKAYLDQLFSRGVVDLEDYLSRYPEEVVRCAKLVRVLDVNDAALALHRAPDKSSLLGALGSTFTEQSFAAFQRELIAMWNGETRLQVDAVVKTLDGKKVDVTVHWSISPGSERTYDRVVVSLVDISERKRMEEHLRETHAVLERRVADRTRALSQANARLQREIAERQAVNESLRQREEELRSLLDNSPDMILKTDPHLKIIWANRTSLEMNPDCVGMTCYRAFPGRDEVCEGCPVAKALETKRLERGVMYQPVSDTAPDEQYWENIGVPQFDENGEVIAGIEISRNITDRMQINRKLEAANKELEAFAYSVSHDLRAPLRHIGGFLELLKKKAARVLDEQCQHYMDIIAESAQKMGLLIEDLLSFSRMGRQPILPRRVDLESLVQGIMGEFELDTNGRNIDWRIGELPVVSGDASTLRIVLTNLIANALKFTRPREKARIEIGSLTGQNDEAVIFVRDNGVGFDMTYADKLFGVFQRLHHADEFEGTGIGLASVRRIITRHGGRTWAKGEVNQGAAFYFSLPQIS